MSPAPQADESFRIETQRHEAHANTPFDTLGADAGLTQERVQDQQALHDLLIARAALRRAVSESRP